MAKALASHVLLGGLLAALIGCSSATSNGNVEPTGAGTVQVTRTRMEQTIKARAIAKPRPNALVRIGFPMPKDVSRRIGRLEVVEGDSVKAGDVLAELDHEDLKAGLRQLAAEAGVVERQLQALRRMEPLDIRMAESAVAETKAQSDLAEQNMQRVDELFKRSITPKQAWDAAVNEVTVARAKHNHAETSLENTRAKFQTDIATAEAKLSTVKAAMESVEVQIRWSVLRAPIDGQVFTVHQRRGELANSQPQSPVVTLLDPLGIQLHLYVDESDFGRVATDQKVTFRLDSHPDKTLSGTIVRILPQPILQENVVYYLAVVDVDRDQRRLLRPEMTALAYVQMGTREGVLRLPLSAVTSRSDGWYATRLDPAGPVETAVKIGWKDETGVEIVEGLKEGDVVLLGAR
jgi:HlyD family secretion protein/macrolide-specific efflux system membrane fusion protein